MRSCKKLFYGIFICFYSPLCIGQAVETEDSSHFIRLKASNKYSRGPIHRFFWGNHYRQEWQEPVTFRKVLLDTLAGGLIPYQLGGGRQSKSIRVTDKDNREYVFRSIDKSFGKALPEILQGSFIESIADGQVTISHPYSVMVVAPLAEAAHIYHTNPELFYVPKQPALGKFNDSAGNTLYSFEQRPDEDWETAQNFGNSKKIISTDKMLEKILADNDNTIDQQLFARSRLFDMLIGDWGRHEDQWRWASFKDDKKTLYAPIPRDRDNAFTKFDGFLLNLIIPAANAKHLQTFDHKIKDVARLNFPARNLDHHLLNQVTLQEWIAIATDIKTRLTDNIIENAVKQMPPEVYPISGAEITAKLKSRREMLPEYAAEYYRFLSDEVEITGTEKAELFEVKRLSDEETEVSLYKITKEGNTKAKPFFHRIFKTNETTQLRLYGIAGNDEYKITGQVKKGIKIRLIGGVDKDKYQDESTVGGPSHKTKIYDNYGNDISTSKETVVNLSKSQAINQYDFKYFNYNKKGLAPKIFYNNEDRVYAGIGYNSKKYKWRKYPLANTESIDVKYSISQKGFSSTYQSTFTDLLGNWNLNTYANFDEIRWRNFYGLGNETLLNTTSTDFYRMRSKEFNSALGVDRVFNGRHKLIAGTFYQNYTILNDTARFLAKEFVTSNNEVFQSKDFGGLHAGYIYQVLNDSVLPVKGISLALNGSYINNLRTRPGDVEKYSAEINLYAPITRNIGFVIRGGGATLTGSPEFFQYNYIGGTESLRGYQRERFYGTSTAFSQNELRWISNVRSYLFNGKLGVFGLYDAGRVWLKGQDSNGWHTGYGGGIIISPFNKITITAAYAVSSEDTNIHIHVVKPF